MAKYPIKVLLDELKRPFFPLVTIDTIVTNNSDKTLRELFEERYTKAEVDKLISDLGTLQRLRGTVTTYEELLAIEDPMPGDTYILLVEGGNNAEYMYIGDKWEALGPTASYTDVYGKEDVDGMLLALKQELNTKTERDDAEVLAQAKLYAEDLFANVPAPNLDEYYKKSETDAKIDEKINAIPVNNLWHYKGHFATVEDLPSTGQPSGIQTSNHCSFSNTVTKFKTGLPTYPIETSAAGLLKLSAKYWLFEFSTHVNGPTDFGGQGFGFCTDYPEMIEIGIGHNSATGHATWLYHIKYDPNKPVYYCGYVSSYASCIGEIRMATASGIKTLTNSYNKLNTVTEEATFYKYNIYEGGQTLSHATYNHLYGNIPYLKFKAWSSLPFTIPTDSYNYVIKGGYDSASFYDYDNNIYVYTDGMTILKFAEVGCARLVCSESLAKENEIATVGEHNDLYRCNSIPKWAPVNERVASSGGTGVVINRWEGVA